MRLRQELTYDSPVDQVFAMVTDPAFWDEVADATGALSSTSTVEESASGTVVVVVDQQQEVTGVPAFAKKFVGDSTRSIKRQAWDGHRSTFEVETPGKPTHIIGTAALTVTDGGTLLTYDLEVKASVPLVGGRLEKLVVDLTTDGFDKEQAVGTAWLRGNR
ncbi:DUF2505 domain-containing protein [Nocardioides terrisoli]|uniref:DUF2505 domain-containing protein n=1 Tax=Nocardioides terrisoli TaxID=3388267 RepID=UPI00287BA0C3|nr:DUF2505 domain-containing protein [Nocardioides marmorisolisilvae]